MKLNKSLFLTFLIILILIIPNAIYANEVDLGVNNYNMMEDDSNLMLNQDNSSGHDLNSINGIGDVKNEISSAVDDNSLEPYSRGSSTLEEKDYLVSDNSNSSEDITSEESFNEEKFSNNMLDEEIITDDECDFLSNISLKNSLKDGSSYNIFIISDTVGNNLFDAAACEILDDPKFSNVVINIRSGSQVNEMSEEELYDLMNSCDAFLGQWVSSNVDAVLTNLLGKYPELSNKKVFLILEPPTGNIDSTSTSLNLVRNSTINNEKIFLNIANDDLVDYFKNTKRGDKEFEIIYDYINDYGDAFPAFFNNLVLYKDINDKSNLKNEILCTLNFLGYPCEYEDPNFTGVQNSGIFRDRWYSLDEYIATFFNSSNERTIGILESTMYIQSQQLDLVNSITGHLFLENPDQFDINVDAIISMVAYGVGGENFTNATHFFEDANVPVFRAVHSEYITNEQWELSPIGLTTTKSDKWWHVTIAESQGIFDATFIGGVDSYISNKTGANILTFIPVERNIQLLADRVDSWVDLQYTPNIDKMISIIYYNYPPGKQNIGASYLDAITSIYNMLYTLKAEGYNVTDLPNNVSELEDLMLTCGINVANWAPGEVEKLANRSGVTLLPADEYMAWFNSLDDIVKLQVTEGPVAYIGQIVKKAVLMNYTDEVDTLVSDWYNQIKALLPDDQAAVATSVLDNIVNSLKLYANTSSIDYYNEFLQYYDEFKSLNISGLNGWGEAPGNIMLVNRNGIDYFVIPGLTFGNVFIGPEPQRGWEANIENLYHCTAVAPTHQYLAAYYYMQTRHSNAMVFVGRHATHEWLPGKEVLLSYNDYGSIVVGRVPQVYFYITDGLAEAIQAKRRGFAVLISHLDSPKSFTHLYGNLTLLANLLEEYSNSNDADFKESLSNEIKDLVIKNDYHLTVGMSEAEINASSMESLIPTLETFLKNTQDTLYPLGLHAIGQKWTDEDLANTVSIIASHSFEVNGEKTNLLDQLSQNYYSMNYSSLSPLKREFILNKSVDICKALIYWDVDTVSEAVGINSLEFMESLNIAKTYIDLYNQCIDGELDAMVSALNGQYIPVNIGGESVTVPQVLPTGANMFQDQSSELPTEAAWNYAKTLTLLTLADLNDTTEKIIMGIWCVETARDDGALVSAVLYLLGMKPVWHNSNSAGYDEEGYPTGKKVEDLPDVIELEDLTRPEGWNKKRIDVTVITSGLFRDLYSSQARLLDNAYRMALIRSYNTIIKNKTLMDSEYGPQLKAALTSIAKSVSYKGLASESLEDNYVAKHWVEDCIYYLSLGYNTTQAGENAITRIFAPPNGDYGAGISKLVSMSWTWNDTDELSEFYIGRMGNMYSKYYWGETDPVVFMRALSDADHIVVSRNTNQYGVLDNDDFFDYWGGLSMTVAYLSNKTPTMNVLMYADKDKAYVSSFEKVFYNELNTRYLNPEWIKGMMQEGYSGARYISNKFISNLWGWQVTRPSSVSQSVWDNVYKTYYQDKYGLGVKEWLKTGNNAYSLISLSGTMMTSAYEGYWDADDATLRDIANTWAEATIAKGVACCDCSCGNVAMMEWAMKYVNADLLAKLLPTLYNATLNPKFMPNATDMPSNATDIDSQTTENVIESNSTSKTVPTNTSSSTKSQSSRGNTDIQGSSSGASVGMDYAGKADSDSDSNAGTPDAVGEGRAMEVTQHTSTPVAPKDVSMPIAIIVSVICLVILIGFGYFRNKDDDDYYDDMDDDFEYK